MKKFEEKVVKETELFYAADEWIDYMKNILSEVDQIKDTPACYNPKPYVKIIKRAVKVGKMAISQYEQ